MFKIIGTQNNKLIVQLGFLACQIVVKYVREVDYTHHT
ncbi:hypothetical protein F383_31908 [Gossypium arboreum]|uniref:Uncharacterized protein n=1 Tax=Gossypium arboreum TaxID=29729 RepID=A0A0B0N2K2_GOSAR|nr:hypothetical protein F383_31908 [Gossypium arboreum]